jgi:ribosome-associated protein
MTSDFDPSLSTYLRAALLKKAERLVVLDVRALTSIADGFIICSGRSSRQVTAIGQTILTTLKKMKIFPLSVEGLEEGHWALLDYGHIIIHVFYEPVREFYDLESLWIDAQRIKIDRYTKTGIGVEDEE